MCTAAVGFGPRRVWLLPVSIYMCGDDDDDQLQRPQTGIEELRSQLSSTEN